MNNFLNSLGYDQYEELNEGNSIGQFLGGYGNINEASSSGEENRYTLKRDN